MQGIEVTVINAASRVVVNPAIIGLVLQGPASVLANLTPGDFIATIDVEGLPPQAADYRIEPLIRLESAELASRVQVLAITPQNRLDVHVFAEPRR